MAVVEARVAPSLSDAQRRTSELSIIALFEHANFNLSHRSPEQPRTEFESFYSKTKGNRADFSNVNKQGSGQQTTSLTSTLPIDFRYQASIRPPQSFRPESPSCHIITG